MWRYSCLPMSLIILHYLSPHLKGSAIWIQQPLSTDIIDTCSDDCRTRQLNFGDATYKKLQLRSCLNVHDRGAIVNKHLLNSKYKPAYFSQSDLGLQGLPSCAGLPVRCSVLVSHGLPYKAAAACITISQQIWARLNCPSSSVVWTAEIQIQE